MALRIILFLTISLSILFAQVGLDDVDALNKHKVTLVNIDAKLEARYKAMRDAEKLTLLPVKTLIAQQQVHLLYLPELLIIHIATGGQGAIFAAVLKQKVKAASVSLDGELRLLNNALASARKAEDVELLRTLQESLLALQDTYVDILERMPIYKGHFEE